MHFWKKFMLNKKNYPVRKLIFSCLLVLNNASRHGPYHTKHIQIEVAIQALHYERQQH